MARGGSVVLAASAPSATAAEPRVTSKSTSTLPRARHIEAPVSQKRKPFRSLLSHATFERCSSPDLGNLGLFHQTTPRRSEVVIYDAADILIGCLEVMGFTAGLIGLLKHLHGFSTLAPHSWARHANEQTRNEVEMTMSTAFNMARNAPPSQRNSKLRDATFHVPHELARLNGKAPDFRLEDLGPMAPGKIPWDGVFRKSTEGLPLNANTETRAFLYFPKGSPKATAVFLAINSELKYPKQFNFELSGYSEKPLALLRAFRVVYTDWQRNRPSLVERIVEVDRLPVICNFQERVFGCMYYPIIRWIGIPFMSVTPMVITDFGLKTSWL